VLTDVCEAIRSRRLIGFAYHGSRRIVEPYAHGFNRGRREAIRGYQVAGQSATSEVLGWKFFIAEDMTSFELLSATFVPRLGYIAAARDLIVIHCTSENPLAQESNT